MKWLVVISVLCALASLAAALHGRLSDGGAHWKAYKSKYNKVYGDPGEELMRKRIFLENKQKIERHNAELAHKLGYRMGINHLTDCTSEELVAPRVSKKDMVRMRAKQEKSKLAEKPEFLSKMLEVDVKDLPKEVDWRKVPGRVGPVKEQGYCLAHWAFATTGLLEGQQYKLAANNNNSQVTPLSDENLIDCSQSNYECQGGFVDDALEDIAAMGGIQSAKEYPYHLFNHRHDFHECTFNVSKSVMTVKGSQLLDETEETLMKVVAQFGPVATGIQASTGLIFYNSGVYYDPVCTRNPLNMNQILLVVGYGHDEHGGDYWIVKNHWGTEWGEKGFFRMVRNRSNHCGIANYGTIPIM